MQEDFLHYIWKHKKFQINNLETTAGEALLISQSGQHNLNSGPDFFNAQIKIDKQLWAGNVEVHIKSSDWFLHNHETDKAYDNVILHVVWEHDIEVFRKDNTAITTLELKDKIDQEVLFKYEKLFLKQNKWINCEHDFASVNDFILHNWLERMYFERLERKTKYIEQLVESSKNDWEAVLFKMLTKNFGLKVNGDAFFSLAESLDFSIIRKSQPTLEILEALFFGQANLLEDDIQDPYYLKLLGEYQFLNQKFNLSKRQVLPVKFFRLRPSNFPTIRLSQLASLYNKQYGLFSKVLETDTLSDFYTLFRVSTSTFWETHYTFKKQSKSSIKTLTKPFIDLLLINTILPIKFCYAKQQGKIIDATIVNIASHILSEKNSIITAFNNLKSVSKSALHSQALIELKTEYCNKNKCLQCAIGNHLITK